MAIPLDAERYFVSVTRLRLRSWRHWPLFTWHNLWITRQATRTPGFVGGYLGADRDKVYWTVTLWERQAAMALLRDQGAHRRVMPRLQDWCDEAAVAHWQQATPDLPSVEQAYQVLLKKGHLTGLKHPNREHQQHQIAPPVAPARLPLKPAVG
ncbi:MAG: hypothetical protein O2890_11870 [Cyanobacteria bacterium]|nr:hypothetical protein [Cyanobacteriota bacterium]MDA0867090.1 hypothetical protein [Cyanobacteriota bacterium]